MIIGVYVDDLITLPKSTNKLTQIRQKLSNNFEMKALGPSKYLLGLEIKQRENYIGVSQTKYITGFVMSFLNF